MNQRRPTRPFHVYFLPSLHNEKVFSCEGDWLLAWDILEKSGLRMRDMYGGVFVKEANLLAAKATLRLNGMTVLE